MKTELFTVSKIFNESIFRIPDYQRGYSWEEIHLKDFWTDIEQLPVGKSHYTGVLTVEAVPESTWRDWEDDTWIIRSRRYAPYYVVDGQQRLTTTSILLQCILEGAKEKDLNFTPLETIRRKYIFDQRGDSLSRAYMFGYEKDNPSYEFLKTQIFGEISDRHSTSEPTIYTKNLKNAKKFFSEKIASLEPGQIEELFTKLTQQLVFNVYEIAKEIDVFVAFETMNNRGKPLSALELLKNRLIYLAAQTPGVYEGDGAKLRRIINEAWKTVYHNIGRNENRLLNDDEFLATHLSFFYHERLSKEVPSDEDDLAKFMRQSALTLDQAPHFLLNRLFTRKRLANDAKDDLRDIDVSFLSQYAGDLKRAAETYFYISTPGASNFNSQEKVWLERIGRLRGYGASPTLLSIFLRETETKKKSKFLESHERYLFCLALVAGGRYGYRNRMGMSIENIKYVKAKTSIDQLTTYYDNLTEALFKDVSIGDALHDWMKNGNGYYGWHSVNYFLYEYETHLQGKSKTSREKIAWDVFSREDYQSDYSSVEHIYPQKARSLYWTERFSDYTSAQRRSLRNTLGNLLALSKPKNSSLSNRPFPEKVVGGREFVGYQFGSYSENEVAGLPDWNAEQILERGIRMLTFLEARWRVNIGDRSQKIRALGLQFLQRSKSV